MNEQYQYPYAADEDVLAMQQLLQLSGPYLPWNPYSIRPCHLVAVLNEIFIGNRRQLVECGSGMSTLYIGRLLRQLGAGHLLSIEHDRRWGGLIADLVRGEKLSNYVQVIYAPLKPSPFPEVTEWYDTSIISETVGESTFDLLLVDGPPAYTADRQYARYPAFPFFRPHLEPNAVVFLDDTERAGELHIIKQWTEMDGTSGEFVWPSLAKVTV